MPRLFRSRIALLMILSGLAIPAQESEIAERLYKSGDRAYAAKSYAEALETWNQLLAQAPKSPQAAEALLKMARHHVEIEKKPEAALAVLDRLKADHMKSAVAPDAILFRGQILASQARKGSDLSEAMGEFNRVADLFPGNSNVISAKLHLGMAAKRQEQWTRALQNFLEVLRLNPGSDEAPPAMLHAAEVMDFLGDQPGCLRMLQSLRNRFPKSPEAEQAAPRSDLILKQRILKAPLRSEGPWPAGRQKWLKTPTLLSINAKGEVFIYQDDLDKAFQLKEQELLPIGATAKNAKALVPDTAGSPWLLSPKLGIFKEGNTPQITLPPNSYASGMCLDGWQNLWVCDGKGNGITVFRKEGGTRNIPAPAAAALASLPTGGAVMASDANKSLLFLDGNGLPKLTIPYGKDLPAGYRYVLALSTDLVGNVAAIVDGEFEGVILLGPDGTLLRFATFKSLGLSGRFRAIAQDLQGGILLADRSNDLLIRMN